MQPEGGIGLTVPRFRIPDGRSARQAQVTWLPQRYLEMLLFYRTDGGSSGAVNKLLNKVGLGPTAWVINAAAVTNEEISQEHADFVISMFRDLLPSNSDAVLGGRTRNVTLLPVASAASICRTRGRSPTTIAFLRACAPQEVPRSWELQEWAEELEEDEANPVLEEDLAEAEDADADVAFADELQAGGFASYNTTAADEANAREYGLKASDIPANLARETDKYIAFKVAPLEARRASTAVVEKTAQADLNAYYRFLGFLKLKRLLPADVLHLSLGLLAHPSAHDWVSAYLNFMKDERELAYSSMANYLSSLYSLATFVFESDDFDVPDVVANAQHTALTACVNLRSQCEALAKEKGLYSEKRGGWITWKQAQEARVKCLNALSAYKGTDSKTKKQLLMDAIVLTIFTYGPVDRVGVIRKLRLNDTLVRGDDGSYSVDLTKAMRGHKSAKYHGGTKHKLPPPTWPLLDKLCRLTQFDLAVGASKYYVLHNTRTGDATRALTEGPFGQWVAGLFLKYAGTRVVPKNLRSIFIVWLRDQEDATERILNASATAMRHHPNTQQSLSYDVETNNRQIALANAFAAKYAAQFKPAGGAAGSSGSSGLGGGGAMADDEDDDEDGWETTKGIWFAKREEEQPADAETVHYSVVLPVTAFAGYRKGDLARFDAPGADETTFHTLPDLPISGALRFTLPLDARAATGDTVSITEMKMKRAAAAPAPAAAPPPAADRGRACQWATPAA